MDKLKSFYYDKKAQVSHIFSTEPPGVRFFVGLTMIGRPLLLNGNSPLWLRPGHDELD